ncbi:MAG TPA: zinc-ribbon domain-containing protein [Candidatus Dorea intestinavium]|nr:zinc-ribbon domain-containing protein [Candidatus Dorea intestinavium]
MREKLQRFMIGRYGQDELNRTLNISALICIVLSFFIRPFYYLALLLLIYEIFRSLSRNFAARSKELGHYKEIKNLLFGTKTHKIFRCKNCHQQIRVPRGKGKISITCPKCKHQFIKRT